MSRLVVCDVCSNSPEKLIYLQGSIYTDNADIDIPSDKFVLFEFSTLYAVCSKECFDTLVFSNLLEEALK